MEVVNGPARRAESDRISEQDAPRARATVRGASAAREQGGRKEIVAPVTSPPRQERREERGRGR